MVNVINFKDASNNPFTTKVEVDANGTYTPHHVVEVSSNPVSITNPLPVLAAVDATYVPAATNAITTGGTSQLLFNGVAVIKGFRVQNPSYATESLYINDAGLAASANTPGSLEIPIGSLYESVFPPAVANVYIVANTTGHTFFASSF